MDKRNKIKPPLLIERFIPMGTNNSSSSLIKEHFFFIFTCGFIGKGNVVVQDKILIIHSSWCLAMEYFLSSSNNAIMSYSITTAT